MNIGTFLSEYYFIFIILGIILVFAIIGYIIDSKDIEIEKPKTVKVNVNSHGETEQLPKTKESALDEVETLDDVKKDTETEQLADNIETDNTETLDDAISDETKEETETLNKTEKKEESSLEE